MLTEVELIREAGAAGFRPEVLEKAIRLLELLELLCRHPFLRGRMALKGGTALNLFLFELPRLSVDIDLNYVGAADRATMVEERPRVEQSIQAVCGRLGLQVMRVPADHAGGKWRISYRTVGGRPGRLELDMNFLLRTPLWPVTSISSNVLASFVARNVPVLDVHELAAGKLAALFGRSASRDLFDSRELLQQGGLDPDRLRLGFVVYGGISRRDWRQVALDEIEARPDEVDRLLVPVLRADVAPDRGSLADWTERLAADSKQLLSAVLPLRANEREFLDRLNDRGEIVPELLTEDAELRATLRRHPGLLWKALNVRKHRGLE